LIRDTLLDKYIDIFLKIKNYKNYKKSQNNIVVNYLNMLEKKQIKQNWQKLKSNWKKIELNLLNLETIYIYIYINLKIKIYFLIALSPMHKKRGREHVMGKSLFRNFRNTYFGKLGPESLLWKTCYVRYCICFEKIILKCISYIVKISYAFWKSHFKNLILKISWNHVVEISESLL